MKRIKPFGILLIFLITLSCIEEYKFDTTEFDSILIVESRITNENKKFTVKLSRTIPIDSVIPDSEKNAIIKIKSSNGMEYNFTEIEAGFYESNIAFSAIENVTYTLFIDTENGENYSSTPEKLTPLAPIENLSYVLGVEDNINGVNIVIDSQDNPNAKYYQYEYEETYKIVTPYLVTHNLNINNIEQDPLRYQMSTTPVLEINNICYNSNIQDKIILLENSNKNEQFPIKFIQSDDFMLRERYSILVKQYILDINTYLFFDKINSFDTQENLFTAVQTGFINGNIKSNNQNQKVIGYFNVSSYSEKRIYFNYFDLNFNKPDYLYECFPKILDYYVTGLDDDQRQRIYDYFYINPEHHEIVGHQPHNPFRVINSECGNCTTFSSNSRPDFWED